jgi:membrane-associated protease RseP (regulator of RpoE activity)
MDDQFRTNATEPIDVEYRVTKGERAAPPPPPARKEPNPAINLILFLVTLFTTTYAGALMEVGHPGRAFSQLHQGLSFSLTLLLILLCHEFGHYFMARKHGVEATLPYFIPAPSLIGTFGAVIKMRSPLYSKRSLLDIGAAGPLAGVVIAIPASVIGLQLSEIRPVSGMQGGISLGSSLLFSLLSRLSVGALPENTDILLHPMAFAGWIGLLVTMLNLLPVGQLDGGHVAYALLGRFWHRVGAYLVLPVLFILGVTAWQGWLIWCVLLLFLIGTKHPPTIDDHVPLDGRRKVIGWCALALFVLTFTPVPFAFSLTN